MADDPTEPDETTAEDATGGPVDDVLVTDAAAEATVDVEATAAGTDGPATDAGEAAPEADAEPVPPATPLKPGAAAVGKAAAPVVRKKVVSKRVTPKGTPQGAKAVSSSRSSAARAVAPSADAPDEAASYSARYTPPVAKYQQGPSPWWVPAIMFGLLIIGALIIMLNYMSVFGEPENLRLVFGLVFILGGIITATQYR